MLEYSDSQRIEKMRDTTRKLLVYIEQSGITKEDILTNETIQWTITTPLYNIGEQAYNLSAENMGQSLLQNQMELRTDFFAEMSGRCDKKLQNKSL